MSGAKNWIYRGRSPLVESDCAHIKIGFQQTRTRLTVFMASVYEDGTVACAGSSVTEFCIVAARSDIKRSWALSLPKATEWKDNAVL